MRYFHMGAGVLVAVASVAGLMVTTAQASSLPTYYLALGDSLSTGGGATPGDGYVNDVFAWASKRIPGLQLENLGCGGDSTTRMIHGGLCHDYTTGDQLGDAEVFLRAHTDEVAFVTIDVGGDDIDGCGISGTISASCVSDALSAVKTNLPIIMSGLRDAGGSVPVVGMTYYDPYLAAWYSGAWFDGSPSEQLARESLPVLHSLNIELASSYRKFGAKVANVQRPFKSSDWNLIGSFMGETLPQNVANICNWTNMCLTAAENPNFHTNDVGHSVIAAAYEKVLRGSTLMSRVHP